MIFTASGDARAMPNWSVKLGMVTSAKAVRVRSGTAPSGGRVVACPMATSIAAEMEGDRPNGPAAFQLENPAVSIGQAA